MPLDEAYEGCYILETSLDKSISKKEVDDRYHTQHEVEEIFKACKDELKLRPNHHQKDENIAGHIYLTFLAYFVQRYLELKLIKNQCNEKASKTVFKCSKMHKSVEKGMFTMSGGNVPKVFRVTQKTLNKKCFIHEKS